MNDQDSPGRRPAGGSTALQTIPESEFAMLLQTPQDPARADDDEAIHFRDLWRVVVKRKWVVFAVIALVLAAALLYTMRQTPIYRAQILMKIEQPPRIIEFKGGFITPEESGDWEYFQTQFELLKSRSMAERVVEQLNARQPAAVKKPEGGSQSWWSEFEQRAFGGASPAGADASSASDVQPKPRRVSAGSFSSSLAVQPVKNTRLVRLYYDSADPVLAADALNALAESFIGQNMERKFESSSYAKNFLEEKLAQTKAKLEEAEREMIAFQRENRILAVDEKQGIVGQALAEYNSAVAKVEERERRIETERQEAEKARVAAEQARLAAEALRKEGAEDPESLPEIANNVTLNALKDQRAKLLVEYQGLLSTYRADFAPMKRLRASIEDFDAKIKEETQAALLAAERASKARAQLAIERAAKAEAPAATRQDLKLASAGDAKAEAARVLRSEADLRARVEASRQAVLALQDRSIRYGILKRDVDTYHALYDGLLQRLKEVGVEASGGVSNIVVVDSALVPAAPYKPNLTLNLQVAAVLGVVLAIGVAFFLDYLDDTLHTPQQMETVTRLPVLGVIPVVDAKKKADATSIAMLAHTDMRSTFAESYRSMRTALQFSTREGAPRELVITSTSAREGKSTTALSLAINFAQTGKAVLLIDADLRNPALHRMLGIDNTRGLSNFLSGDIPPLSVVRSTSVPNLFVMPAGPTPPNPVELLSGPKLSSMIEQLREKFAQIVIDSPPVLGLADAIVLGNQVGTAVFVVSANSTRKGEARVALRRLRQAGIQPIGAVMTKVNLRDGAYGYESSYYYYRSTNDAPELPAA